MENIEKKDRLRGILGTIIFHGILVGAFLFFGFKTPLPLPEEEGIEVRLGDLDGMGEIDFTPPPAYIPATPSNPEESEEEVVSQNIEETPKIAEKTKTDNVKKTTKTEITTKEINKEPVINDNYQFKPGQKTGHNQGNTGKPGYQGSPNGNPNATSPVGSNGNGISFNLGGRNSKFLPRPEYDSPEQGKVVVSITVDRNGKVIKAIAGAKGTTTTDPTLRTLATQAALRATFDAKLDAAEEQIGTITYNFIKLN